MRYSLGPQLHLLHEIEVGSPWPHLLLHEMQGESPWLHLLIHKKQVSEPVSPEDPPGWDIPGFYNLSVKRGNCQEPMTGIQEELQQWCWVRSLKGLTGLRKSKSWKVLLQAKDTEQQKKETLSTFRKIHHIHEQLLRSPLGCTGLAWSPNLETPRCVWEISASGMPRHMFQWDIWSFTFPWSCSQSQVQKLSLITESRYRASVYVFQWTE